MDLLLWIKVVILGAVEGFTEFLPVSSTGHLIVVGQLLGFNDEKGKIFEIVIQTGAMLAIVWEYRVKFAGLLGGVASDRKAQQFVINLAIAFMPAAVLGLLFGKYIKAILFKPVPVAIAFIVGGLIILWAERRKHTITVQSADDMKWTDALKVGCAQAFALIPGTSRSGATIIGGLLFGLSRRAATEFSFFLAVPTLIAAGAYDLIKNRALFQAGDIGIFALGMGVSFICAFWCVRWLLRYIATHDFTPFAWYRIVFGLVVLGTGYFGLVSWQA